MILRSATGKSSLVPDMPWNKFGAMLKLKYMADPTRVTELLPDYLKLADEHPGSVAVF